MKQRDTVHVLLPLVVVVVVVVVVSLHLWSSTTRPADERMLCLFLLKPNQQKE